MFCFVGEARKEGERGQKMNDERKRVFFFLLSLFLPPSFSFFFLIAAGYCGDFEQFCPGGLATPVTAAGTKCLKMSSSFMGQNLRGTPFPTAASECVIFSFFFRTFFALAVTRSQTLYSFSPSLSFPSFPFQQQTASATTAPPTSCQTSARDTTPPRTGPTGNSRTGTAARRQTRTPQGESFFFFFFNFFGRCCWCRNNPSRF